MIILWWTAGVHWGWGRRARGGGGAFSSIDRDQLMSVEVSTREQSERERERERVARRWVGELCDTYTVPAEGWLEAVNSCSLRRCPSPRERVDISHRLDRFAELKVKFGFELSRSTSFPCRKWWFTVESTGSPSGGRCSKLQPTASPSPRFVLIPHCIAQSLLNPYYF